MGKTKCKLGTNYYVRGKVVNNSSKTFDTVYVVLIAKSEPR